MPRSMTCKQREILHFVFRFSQREGYPPTIREIGDALDISSLRGVTVHLDSMERKGLLKRGSTARGIQFTETGRQEVEPLYYRWDDTSRQMVQM